MSRWASRGRWETPRVAMGWPKFGFDEWEDLEAAIAYAKMRGAADVILAGGSMGGRL